jgi:hypothetical protein
MAIVVSTSSTDASLSKEKVLMDDGNWSTTSSGLHPFLIDVWWWWLLMRHVFYEQMFTNQSIDVHQSGWNGMGWVLAGIRVGNCCWRYLFLARKPHTAAHHHISIFFCSDEHAKVKCLYWMKEYTIFMSICCTCCHGIILKFDIKQSIQLYSFIFKWPTTTLCVWCTLLRDQRIGQYVDSTSYKSCDDRRVTIDVGGGWTSDGHDTPPHLLLADPHHHPVNGQTVVCIPSTTTIQKQTEEEKMDIRDGGPDDAPIDHHQVVKNLAT